MHWIRVVNNTNSLTMKRMTATKRAGINKKWYGTTTPFCKSVKTNTGKKFLTAIKKYFPTSNPLSRIFNKNTEEISCCYLPSTKASETATNNKSPTENLKDRHFEEKCNCRDKSKCSLNGKCQEKGVIYKATVETDNRKKSCVGLATNLLKSKLNSHRSSFDRANLSKYIYMKLEGQEHKPHTTSGYPTAS